ncbi:MAG: N-acetylgalactosamine 6-sulfate sulfatase, partial [Opitutaceae bacterium]
PRYRLDSRGALFDLQADPGQTKDIATAQPAVAAKLEQAVAAWRVDVFGADIAAKAVESRTSKKGKTRGGYVVPDDRPYPVGYREFPWTPLPARDGVPHGGVRRSSSAPNSSYFVNWRTTEDRITWDVELATAGTYKVVIDYTCVVSDAGAEIELSFRDAKLTGKVAPGWDPPLNTNQDTLPRPDGESQMKEFRPLNLGTVRLEQGRGELTLRALKVPGKSVMDVRRVNLTLKN